MPQPYGQAVTSNNWATQMHVDLKAPDSARAARNRAPESRASRTFSKEVLNTLGNLSYRALKHNVYTVYTSIHMSCI